MTREHLESRQQQRGAQAGLPDYTPLRFRYDVTLFSFKFEEGGSLHEVLVLTSPQDGGVLPNGYMTSHPESFIGVGNPYLKMENGKVFFSSLNSWRNNRINPRRLSQSDYQQAIYVYCNFLAAKAAEQNGKDDFLLLEDEYLGGKEWIGFEYSPAKRTHRRIIGRYRSRLGVEYALAQRTRFLESLAGRGRFTRNRKRTEYEVRLSR